MVWVIQNGCEPYRVAHGQHLNLKMNMDCYQHKIKIKPKNSRRRNCMKLENVVSRQGVPVLIVTPAVHESNLSKVLGKAFAADLFYDDDVYGVNWLFFCYSQTITLFNAENDKCLNWDCNKLTLTYLRVSRNSNVQMLEFSEAMWHSGIIHYSTHLSTQSLFVQLILRRRVYTAVICVISKSVGGFTCS